ncbi:MAG: hypothetical protein HY906_24415 [Deltaproteobacteria bacterium]|nr:hypothetical protein [Deltaproteobacteria bacterium]
MGSAQVISLTVGGQTPSGGDATNRTSFLFLNALRMARVPYPNVTVRLHQQTPKEFVPECVRSVQMGLGHPAFYSDAAIVTGLTSFGIPQEHARDYHVMGCNEVMISGRCRTYKAPNVKLCDFSNLASASPKSFDDLLTAYDGALQKKIDDMQPIGWTWCDPFASAMTSKCVERGLDLHAGGAEYWLSGVWGMGLGTAADSLAAMKKVLFDDKQATASELVAAIQANFAGQYATLQQLLRDAPKYGNDEGSDSDPNRVDKLAAHVAQVFCDAVKQRSQQSQQQGKTMFLPMLASFRMHVETTTSFPATPDGRNATRPISDSASPSQGQGKEGVTCVLHAASNIDFSRSAGGSSFNVKLLPSLVAGDTGRQMLACLVNTYLLDMGGGQIQINVVTSDDLQDAIDNPDRHRDLLVRVAGFCAYFVDLDVALQKEIVSRLEQENWAACWPSCS